MVATRKEPDGMASDLTIVKQDDADTRQLGSVAQDLIYFPSSKVNDTLSGPCIHLYLPDNSDPIELQNVARVTIGRVDRYSTQTPMIDLSDHHAKLLGVSRLHAEIVYNNDKYYIRDLGSTNGTWVNDTQVLENQQVQLLNGDTVRLGHLMIQVGGVCES